MSLITINNLKLSFGGPAIFDDLSLKVDKGERLCILGRNGAGKSSLLKLLMGEIQAEEGELNFQQGLKVSFMNQEVPNEISGSCFEVVASGLEQDSALLQEYYRLIANDNHDTDELIELQSKIDSAGLWDLDKDVSKALSLLDINGDDDFAALSGGRKRRVWLARALVCDPDVLLLDEPTNHVDIETVQWLEDFFSNYRGSIIFISHDRSFISKLATRIIDIDRGKAQSWPGDYQKYLQAKAAELEVEEKQNAEFDKKLAKEEIWIRQGIKARRTRNEGRVRALKALRAERMQRRDKQGRVSFDISAGEKSGKVVIEAKNLFYSYSLQHEGQDQNVQLIKGFSSLINRGDKIGIIGPNGVGKSTLVKILLGELEADSGEIKLGSNLNVAYFDQLRTILNEQKTLMENVVEGSDFVEIDGHRIHVISYLQDFLFPKERMRTPVSALSGGERNRLLLAKLFTKPSNFLVLDEPTNDLDVETLELLEEKLLEFKGTLLLISHDRTFLNNVVTSTIVFEKGEVNQYVGAYDDWLSQRSEQAKIDATEESDETDLVNRGKDIAGINQEKVQKKKLSYKDQRELDQLPNKIDQLENEIGELQEELSDPEIYQTNHEIAAELGKKLEVKQAELQKAYERWDILDQD